MFETNQQPFNWRRALGCFAGFIGGGLAFLSLLIGICAGSYGELKKDDPFVALLVGVGVLGIGLIVVAFLLWRKR
jgi:hypothetical protein